MIRAAARLQRLAAPAALAAALGACSVGSQGGGGSIAEQIGLTTPVPDEYAVVANRELQMPASKELPLPRPGAPSLVEVQPQQEARSALFTEAVGPSAGPSAGEAALLSAAGADHADPSIRETVAAEQDEYVAQNTRFGLTSILGYKVPGAEEEETLDAEEEARRLAAEGHTTPIPPETSDN